jgi:hypothetical protein
VADNKKVKRVSMVFGKQKITTTPALAAKIKAGEIDPSTHTINKDGKFAPKRKAVVGGLGIVPSAGKLGISANNTGDSKVPTAGKAGFKANAESGDNSYDPAVGFYKTDKGQSSAAVAAAKGVPSAEAVAQTAVPKMDKATGQPITPAQNVALQEQKAIKIAPFKADLENMTTQLNALHTELDDADDDEKLGAAKAKIEKLKSSLSATNE